MKKSFIYGIFAAASLCFAACSQDEVNLEEINPNENPEWANGFKPLVHFDITSKSGEGSDVAAESRTLGDVNERFLPTSEYRLNNIYMLRMDPTHQPTAQDKGRLINLGYNSESTQIQEHSFGSNSYTLKYKLGDNTQSHNDRNSSYSGTIYLQYGTQEPIAFQLTVFDLDKLANKHILLNDLPYDQFEANAKLRGSTLRFTSYDPKNVGDIAQEPMGKNRLTGHYVTLPKVDNPELKFLAANGQLADKRLVSETQDQYFMSDEYVIAATGDCIYLLKTVALDQSEKGGYFEVSRYPIPAGSTGTSQLSLDRMTTMVNASFMFTADDGSTDAYYQAGNFGATARDFKRTYGIDLTYLSCPHATLDGINDKLFINADAEFGNTVGSSESRLILWSEGLEVTGIDGNPTFKAPEMSMDITSATYDRNQTVTKGFGFQGNSYSVIFPGTVKDLENRTISFYVKYKGGSYAKQLKLTSTINPSTSLNPNIVHHIVLHVPSKAFADAVNAPSTRGTNYVELNLPSDCVVVE